MDAILKMAGRARLRLMLGRFRQLAVYYVAGGAAVATVASWIARPGGLVVFYAYLAALAAGLVAAAIHAAFARPSIRTAALALDLASGLRERLSTALLVRNGESAAERAVVEDAARAAGSADPSLIPLGRVRRAWWPAVPPLVFAASLAIPSIARDGRPDAPFDPASAIAVPAPLRKEESTGLRKRAFDLERAAGDRDLPELKELAQAMRQISEEIRRSEMSQAEALSKLSRLEDKARERRNELAKEAGLRDPELMRKGEDGAPSAASEEAARRAEELDRKVSELKAKIEEAKKQLAKDGAKGKSPEVQAALAQLGKELEGLGAREMDDLARKLEKAAEEGDAEAMEKMLETLDGEMDDLGEMLEGMELLEGELEALKAMKGRFAGEGKACLFCGKDGGG